MCVPCMHACVPYPYALHKMRSACTARSTNERMYIRCSVCCCYSLNTTSFAMQAEEHSLIFCILELILTWRGSKPDHRGVSSRVRPLHCTSLGLTSAIATSVSNSTVQFLVVGACVRARPLLVTKLKKYVQWKKSLLRDLIGCTYRHPCTCTCTDSAPTVFCICR